MGAPATFGLESRGSMASNYSTAVPCLSEPNSTTTSSIEPPAHMSSNRQTSELELPLSHRKQWIEIFLIAKFRPVSHSNASAQNTDLASLTSHFPPLLERGFLPCP